jgi:hypothetical protein
MTIYYNDVDVCKQPKPCDLSTYNYYITDFSRYRYTPPIKENITNLSLSKCDKHDICVTFNWFENTYVFGIENHGVILNSSLCNSINRFMKVCNPEKYKYGPYISRLEYISSYHNKHSGNNEEQIYINFRALSIFTNIKYALILSISKGTSPKNARINLEYEYNGDLKIFTIPVKIYNKTTNDY